MKKLNYFILATFLLNLGLSSFLFSQAQDSIKVKGAPEINIYKNRKNGKVDSGAEVKTGSSSSKDKTTSSSSFSFNSQSGGSKQGMYSVLEFFDENNKNLRDDLENKLIQKATEEKIIPPHAKSIDFQITQEKVLVNGKQIKGMTAIEFKKMVKETLEHGDEFNYSFSRNLIQ